MPFFSVLLPTRNRAELLELSLDSVLRQSFKDFEIIVSDNNSSDETQKLVMSLAEKDSRIRYFRQDKDLPMGGNWNFCYSKASGEFFLLLGDDDAILPDILENVHQLICSHQDADVVGFRYAQLWYGKNLLVWNQPSGDIIEGSKDLFLKRAFDFITPIEHTLVVRKGLAQQVSPKNGPYSGAYLDQMAWFGFYSQARKIYYLERIGIILGVARNSSTVLQKGYKTRHEAFRGVFSLNIKFPMPGDYFANMQYEVLAAAKEKYPDFCTKPITLTKYWAKIGTEISLFLLQTLANFDFAGFRSFLGDLKQFIFKAPPSAMLSAIFINVPWSVFSSITPPYFREATKDFALKFMGLRKGYGFKFAYIKKHGVGYSVDEAAGLINFRK